MLKERADYEISVEYGLSFVKRQRKPEGKGGNKRGGDVCGGREKHVNRKNVQKDNGHRLTMAVLQVTFPRSDIMGGFSFLLYILLGCLNSLKSHFC